MDEFYTINQAAIVLKVHPLTIRRYIREAKLKAYRVGGNVRITLNDLRSFGQSFVPHSKSSRTQQTLTAKSFSLNDPFFRMHARGISMSRLEQG